ncbi:MAG: S1 RNA-binding domain-containing protein [Acidimicrobiales bacterium]
MSNTTPSDDETVSTDEPDAPEPVSTAPEPAEPEPVSTAPEPAEPEPAAAPPLPAEPEPAEPVSTAPEPAEPEPAAAPPQPAEPEPAEPEPADPKPTPAPVSPEPAPEATATPAIGATKPAGPNPPPVAAPGGTPPAPATAPGGYESGQILSGPVTAVTAHEVEVDLGDGLVGVVGSRHWAPNLQIDLTGEVTVGDTVEAAVLVREDQRGRVVLSRSWGRTLTAWKTLTDARASGAVVEAVVLDTVKGGLAVDAGIRAFVPQSLIDVDPGFDAEQLVGQTIECRVVDVDQRKGRCVLSRKAVQRSMRKSESRERLKTLKKGEKLTGKVVRLAEFGAFVDVGDGLQGLVHRSELGWRGSADPADVVSVGDEVTVAVLRAQPDKMRLGLTMRLGGDPLRELQPGSRHDGTVSRLVDFGAFVKLENGVEGLVHLSELAEYRVNTPEEVVLPGERVRVEVIAVERRRRRVDLSIRLAVAPQIAPPPVEAVPSAEPAAAEESDLAAEQGEEPDAG